MANQPFGNDIALGWKTTIGPCADGCILDMYTNDYETPSQDVKLVTEDGATRGTHDIRLNAAQESNGFTLLEFSKPLNSGDPFDLTPDWFDVLPRPLLLPARHPLSRFFSISLFPNDGSHLRDS